MPTHSTQTRTVVRAYTSPTLVFLAFDWPDGANHADFLGFSILRDPGFGHTGAPQYFFNKLDFTPLSPTDKPRTSDRAPIQKFNWWDPTIGYDDAGKVYEYTVIPILGTGANDLNPVTGDAGTLKVTVPNKVVGKIGTYFNRAVVSSQAYKRIEQDALEDRMAWLANGIETAVPDFLASTNRFDCGIYHLTDNWKIVPAMKSFPGSSDTVYFYKKKSAAGKGGDQTDLDADQELASTQHVLHQRSHIGGLMHDKYIVAYTSGNPTEVLMGSMNFTPEAATVQANVVHTFASPQLASLYAARHALLLGDPTTAKTAMNAQWRKVTDIPGTQLRVFFSPEPKDQRVSIDTVVDAVNNATSSVLFCMFAPTDAPLLKAILAAADSGKIVYGLRNSLSDPAKPTKSGKVPEMTPGLQVQVDVYNRSRKDHKTVSYNYFRPGSEPADFLPELFTVDTSKYSLHKATGGEQPPAVHVHHKFVIIDADTAQPTVFTGSANMSNNSTHNNDENLLEIKGNVELARTYLAEFMRLYNHYHARAVWDQAHPKKKNGSKASRARSRSAEKSLVLKTTRDEWVKGAYTAGTPESDARIRLAGG